MTDYAKWLQHLADEVENKGLSPKGLLPCHKALRRAADEIERLSTERRGHLRSITNLLGIILDHKICTDDMEDACIRVAQKLVSGRQNHE